MNQKYTKRKGISPVLATIILLAVTVAVGVGVASYVFGLFGTYSESAAIKVQGTATLNSMTATPQRYFNVTLSNAGAQSDSLSSITTTVNGVQYTINSFSNLTSSTIKGGGGTLTVKLQFPVSAAFTAGTSYQVKIGFNSGSLLSTTVTAS
ncbi:MAG: hypothetical protein M1503_09045 [Thaumarchaeota archaeon]|nr:hypothetical protein [Nitrososphaerota archaeon]MCL5318383.1 hypothetical protein [Nitrososphaerota archaeon]